MEHAYNTMMSRNVDMDAIIAEARGRSGHSQQSSGAAPVAFNSSTPSPTLERHQLQGRTSALSGSSPRAVQAQIKSPPTSKRLGEGSLKGDDLGPEFDHPIDDRRPTKRSKHNGTDTTEEILGREEKAEDDRENARAVQDMQDTE
jgi:hypothetical protein